MGTEKSVTKNTKPKLDGGIMEFHWIFSLKARRNQWSAQDGGNFSSYGFTPSCSFGLWLCKSKNRH
jgi:hypothetical protein